MLVNAAMHKQRGCNTVHMAQLAAMQLLHAFRSYVDVLGGGGVIACFTELPDSLVACAVQLQHR
jgi:hypothetical protein